MVDATLRIELTSAGSDAVQERTLECADSQPLESSTVREPEAACEALANAGEKVFFGLPDPNLICTQEYGGPQQAHVTGTLNGKPVDKRFSLTDGCKISEWHAMEALLGGIGGAV